MGRSRSFRSSRFEAVYAIPRPMIEVARRSDLSDSMNSERIASAGSFSLWTVELIIPVARSAPAFLLEKLLFGKDLNVDVVGIDKRIYVIDGIFHIPEVQPSQTRRGTQHS